MSYTIKCQKLKPVPHKNVKINDAFWSPKLKVMYEITLPDVYTKFENDRGGAINNFELVRDGKPGKHAGPPWYDGLIYETTRAASDFLGDYYSEELDKRLDGYIERIAAAQDVDPDGYINTYTTLVCPEYRWGENGGNLLWQHELYNAGCLVEAAVHHYKATGKINLLKIAVKFADYIAKYIGLPPKNNIVPAHSLPEEAFIKLYRLFKENPGLKDEFTPKVDEDKYFELVRSWIYNRGRHEGRRSYPRYMGEYAQDHRPVVEQHEAVGHSVRATLLYNGVVQYAMETGEKDYFEASQKLWEDAVYTKMHINGSVGAVHNEEKFGYEYQLPNNAYLETCAAVGLAFWSGSMNQAFGDAKYMDVVERAIYNGILSGLSLKGNTFFYRNPLESKGDDHRWEWHDCPCCPPMFLKIMADLQSYIYSCDNKGIYTNLYISGSADIDVNGSKVVLTQETKYPWDGNVKISINSCESQTFDLKLRIPDWCEHFKLSVNKNIAVADICDNYAVISREWSSGDEVTLEMSLSIKRMEAHPYVEPDKGRVTIQRGPILYCLEGMDNGGNVDITLPAEPEFESFYDPNLLGGVVVIKGKNISGQEFTAVPYYAWDNREAGTMAVWLKQEGKCEKGLDIQGWNGKLYRPYKVL